MNFSPAIKLLHQSGPLSHAQLSIPPLLNIDKRITVNSIPETLGAAKQEKGGIGKEQKCH
jgi:hypothetical protein